MQPGERLSTLDLFAGIGGFSLGLERTGGFETKAFCEIDPFCQAILRKHWPSVPIYEDVRTIPRIPDIDLICGGVPCQPASLAGKRGGSADPRWLWPAFLEVARASRPRWVVAENPLGITSLKPHGLDWIVGQLADAGYETWPTIISANDVGAPHLRQRVWIIAANPSRLNRETGPIVAHTDRSGLSGEDLLQQGRSRIVWRGETMADAKVLATRGLEEQELFTFDKNRPEPVIQAATSPWNKPRAAL